MASQNYDLEVLVGDLLACIQAVFDRDDQLARREATIKLNGFIEDTRLSYGASIDILLSRKNYPTRLYVLCFEALDFAVKYSQEIIYACNDNMSGVVKNIISNCVFDLSEGKLLVFSESKFISSVISNFGLLHWTDFMQDIIKEISSANAYINYMCCLTILNLIEDLNENRLQESSKLFVSQTLRESSELLFELLVSKYSSQISVYDQAGALPMTISDKAINKDLVKVFTELLWKISYFVPLKHLFVPHAALANNSIISSMFAMTLHCDYSLHLLACDFLIDVTSNHCSIKKPDPTFLLFVRNDALNILIKTFVSIPSDVKFDHARMTKLFSVILSNIYLMKNQTRTHEFYKSLLETATVALNSFDVNCSVPILSSLELVLRNFTGSQDDSMRDYVVNLLGPLRNYIVKFFAFYGENNDKDSVASSIKSKVEKILTLMLSLSAEHCCSVALDMLNAITRYHGVDELLMWKATALIIHNIFKVNADCYNSQPKLYDCFSSNLTYRALLSFCLYNKPNIILIHKEFVSIARSIVLLFKFQSTLITNMLDAFLNLLTMLKNFVSAPATGDRSTLDLFRNLEKELPACFMLYTFHYTDTVETNATVIITSLYEYCQRPGTLHYSAEPFLQAIVTISNCLPTLSNTANVKYLLDSADEVAARSCLLQFAGISFPSFVQFLGLNATLDNNNRFSLDYFMQVYNSVMEKSLLFKKDLHKQDDRVKYLGGFALCLYQYYCQLFSNVNVLNPLYSRALLLDVDINLESLTGIDFREDVSFYFHLMGNKIFSFCSNILVYNEDIYTIPGATNIFVGDFIGLTGNLPLNRFTSWIRNFLKPVLYGCSSSLFGSFGVPVLVRAMQSVVAMGVQMKTDSESSLISDFQPACEKLEVAKDSLNVNMFSDFLSLLLPLLFTSGGSIQKYPDADVIGRLTPFGEIYKDGGFASLSQLYCAMLPLGSKVFNRSKIIMSCLLYQIKICEQRNINDDVYHCMVVPLFMNCCISISYYKDEIHISSALIKMAFDVFINAKSRTVLFLNFLIQGLRVRSESVQQLCDHIKTEGLCESIRPSFEVVLESLRYSNHVSLCEALSHQTHYLQVLKDFKLFKEKNVSSSIIDPNLESLF